MEIEREKVIRNMGREGERREGGKRDRRGEREREREETILVPCIGKMAPKYNVIRSSLSIISSSLAPILIDSLDPMPSLRY